MAPLSDLSVAQSIVEAVRETERQHLNSGTAGNISVRIDGGLLITPTGIPTLELRAEMMVKVSLDGDWSGAWRPSSEWAMHAAIYKAFSAAQAVVHAHADACVALSCLREGLPPFHYMIASYGGDTVRCAQYASFGSPELAQAAVAALEGRTACLLANHGMICYGATLAAALRSAVKLETLARQYLLTRSAGEPVLLNADAMADVHRRYKTYGNQPKAAEP